MNANQIRSYNQKSLTLDQVERVAPSIFASQPWEGVSAKYTFIPTIKVVESLMSEGWQIMQASQNRTRIAEKKFFTKHLIRFRRENELSVNDVFPEIVLINSHDRGSAYQMHAGLFRLVCSNGLIVADATFSKISVRHSGQIVDEVRKSADIISAEMPRVLTGIEAMKLIELTKNEQGIFAETAKRMKYGEESPLQSAQLLMPRRHGDFGNDLWSTFNRVQENITKGGKHYLIPAHRDEDGNYVRAKSRRTRKINSITEDTKINKALWFLAEEMKKLKTV